MPKAKSFQGWEAVAEKLNAYSDEVSDFLNLGQRAALHAIATRIVDHGVILADEVGMGKTRIATALTRAVVESGGRVAILAPPGLGFQWSAELARGGVEGPIDILRSLARFYEVFDDDNGDLLWRKRQVVLISQAFANWRIQEGSAPWWRWGLVQAVHAEWSKSVDGKKFPKGYKANDGQFDRRVKSAARDIVETCKNSRDAGRLRSLVEHDKIGLRNTQAAFLRHQPMRQVLEQSIGMGLGEFDLVVVDEAHKARGDESAVSRFLKNIIGERPNGRRLSMTATPIELHAKQWVDMLARTGIRSGNEIEKTIDDYIGAVRTVRETWRTDQSARSMYQQAAAKFQKELGRYVLRRDKREDDDVRKFCEYTGLGPDTYRDIRQLPIELGNLDVSWRKAVCAAEALSFCASGDDEKSKRLRLHMGNGHGIATYLDQFQADSADDDKSEHSQSHPIADGLLPEIPNGKRGARAIWWRRIIENATASEQAKYHHPSLIAAVEAIESYTHVGEKVLVFGRFNRPLKVLTDLLNTRAMLRHIKKGEPWPQQTLPSDDKDQAGALDAAIAQSGEPYEKARLQELLARQYKEQEARQERLRNHIFELIDGGLSELDGLLAKIAQHEGQDVVPLLARAIAEFLDGEAEPDQKVCKSAFHDLVLAAKDNDISNPTDDDPSEQATKLWPSMKAYLEEEYGGQRGTFARLMYGETKQQTRRLLQLRFNRPRAFPRVLVAQSQVGREGLNLHEACRIVVLYHPEWNPGVVEQQIGRVDRLNSHWAKQMQEDIGNQKTPKDVRKIEILPIIFNGTYDEHHWKVLIDRWDDLQAQLHGIVVPQRMRDPDRPDEIAIAKELDSFAPDFSPSRPTKAPSLNA